MRKTFPQRGTRESWDSEDHINKEDHIHKKIIDTAKGDIYIHV